MNAAVRVGSLEALKKAAEIYFGALSFEVGVYSGMLENLGASAAAMVELGKMFYLAGLYDAALLPPHLAVGPLYLLRIEGMFALLLFRGQLKQAHDQRDKLMAELKSAVSNLGPLLAEAKKKYSKEYVEKWDRFQALMQKSGISDKFEAGRILGGVLMDVILMVLTVIDIAAGAVAAARYLAKIPELVRIARGMEGMEGLLALKRGAAAAVTGEAAKVAENAKGAAAAVDQVPEAAAAATPEMPPPPPKRPDIAEKILYGARNADGDLIGVHSPKVLDHPDFAVERLSTNPDGTIKVKVLKQYPDGTLSTVKKSTLAPESWSDSKIISTTEEVGDLPSAGTREDGATCHMANVDGVNWLTIKDSSGNITAGYPNSSGKMPGGFK